MVNGMAAEAIPASAPVGNPEIIRLLEDVLRGARSGLIVGVGVAVAMEPGQFNALASGTCLAEVNMGLDALKTVLLNASRGQSSGIIRPR